ncbi:MAG: 2Fe-2S iron-sulfur cluster binding domain-containing protein [Zoogloea sp.]|nr:2Fe-2S iron-sulfur cluster binding domain-containing protein [Zoogloea sp.]
MPELTLQPSGKTVSVEPGSSLLAGILAAGEAINHKCDGNAKCGSCHIFVQEGRKSLPRIQRTENEMLDTLVGVGSKSRLACQARMGEENVTQPAIQLVHLFKLLPAQARHRHVAALQLRQRDGLAAFFVGHQCLDGHAQYGSALLL